MQITCETLVLRSQEACGFTPLYCDWLLISLSVLHIRIPSTLWMNMIELMPRFKDQEINILQFFSLYGERIENQNLLGLPALIQEINSHTNNKPLPQFEFFNLGRQAMRQVLALLRRSISAKGKLGKSDAYYVLNSQKNSKIQPH